MKNALVKIFGYPATLIHGDAAVFDRWAWLKEYITRGPVRTLDVGCGSGAFTLYAAKVGNEALGISFDEPNNKKARERAEILGFEKASFIWGDVRKLDEMKDIGLFDQAICFETIEHIKDDGKLVKDISSVLKSGGKLLLTTPYKFYHRLPGDHVSKIENGDHMRWGYTHEEMEEIMKSAGLEVESKDYVTGLVSQALIRLERRIVPISHYLAWVIVLPFRVLRVFDPFVTKFTRYPHLSIGIVARKT